MNTTKEGIHCIVLHAGTIILYASILSHIYGLQSDLVTIISSWWLEFTNDVTLFP